MDHPQVVAEADEVIILWAGEDVLVQAHVDSLDDRKENGAPQADGRRQEIGVVGKGFPCRPRDEESRRGHDNTGFSVHLIDSRW
jgi:hypothetical protein